MGYFYIFKTDDIRDRCIETIRGLDLTETDWQVEIKPFKYIRTVEQNKRFHWVVRCIARFTGDSAEAMKQIICRKFLGEVESLDPETGDVIRYTPSTASLSIAEFDDLIVQTEELANELGVDLDEQSYKRNGHL